MVLYEVAKRLQRGERLRIMCEDSVYSQPLTDAQIHAYGTMEVLNAEHDPDDSRIVNCILGKRMIPEMQKPANRISGTLNEVEPCEAVEDDDADAYNPRTGRSIKIKVCAYCGKKFETDAGNHKYCTVVCQRNAYNQKKYENRYGSRVTGVNPEA